jgi:hypothetical protein
MTFQDEEHMRMIHSYFSEIECSATAIRTINDKIEFFENAIRDARLKALDVERGLTVEQEKAICERDDHGQNASALLDKALSHMNQLSHYPWRLCRDFIVNTGWLEADHPALRGSHGHEADVTTPRQDNDSEDQEPGRAQLFDRWLKHQNRARFGPRVSTTGHANTSYSDRPVDVSPTHRDFESKRDDQDPWGKEAETPHQDMVHDYNRQWQAEADEDPWGRPNKKDASPLTDGNDSWSQRSHAPSATGSAQVRQTGMSSSSARIVKSYWKTSLEDRAVTVGDAQKVLRDPYIYPAEQPPAVPKGHKREVKHSVQIGKGVEYLHNLGTPEYMDTLEDPYVVFTFKYRSAKELEKLVGKGVRDDVRALTEEINRQQLRNLTRDELVEQVLRAKTHEASKSARSSRSWGAFEPKPESKASWSKEPSKNKTDWPNNQGSKHESNNGWSKPKSNDSRHADGRNDWRSNASSKAHDHFQSNQTRKSTSKANGTWQETGQGKTSTSKANGGWQEVGEGKTGVAW